MKTAVRLAIGLCVILAMTFGVVGSAVAAPQDQNGPPLELTVVALYPQAERVFSGLEGEVDQIGFVDEGLYWQTPSVVYYVNLGKQNPAFVNGIIHSFGAWNNVATSYTAAYGGSTKSSPGSLQAKWNRKTGSYTGGLNVVGWKNLGRTYSGAIGVTYIWSYQNTLVEVDTALNSSSQFRWWQTTGVDDPDANAWPSGQLSPAYDVDVQNIMTHEAGHWLVLGDLYDDMAGFVEADREQTMYGYAGEYELQKRSLESGDEAGIWAIYGT